MGNALVRVTVPCLFVRYRRTKNARLKMGTTIAPDVIAQGMSFEQFMNSLRDPAFAAPIVSARRFSEALHIDLQTLAKQAGVHRNTLSRMPASESVQRFLREALRVIRAATDVLGCVGHALFWYRNEPLSEFEYKTAEQLVAGGRTEDVLRYIVSLEANVLAR